MSDLPPWVWDAVIAMMKHSDEHPMYFAEYYPDYKMRKAATCGCEALDLVPTEVQRIAEAIAADRRQRDIEPTP